MYLRIHIGPYAGQVLDFSPAAAEAMLADGRASHPEAEHVIVLEEGAGEPLRESVVPIPHPQAFGKGKAR